MRWSDSVIVFPILPFLPDWDYGKFKLCSYSYAIHVGIVLISLIIYLKYRLPEILFRGKEHAPKSIHIMIKRSES